MSGIFKDFFPRDGLQILYKWLKWSPGAFVRFHPKKILENIIISYNKDKGGSLLRNGED